MSLPTRREVEQAAIEIREDIQLQSYLNCGAVCSRMKERLQSRFDIVVREVEGTVVYTPRSFEGVDHVMLRVPPSEIRDEERHLYIDGTLNQFRKERKESGEVPVALPKPNGDGVATASEFDVVEIFTVTEKDGWWSYLHTFKY